MSHFPKGRVDALTDGVFAFAMTLLVLDIRLPDDLPIHSATDLTAHLRTLWHLALTYLISFFVLGAFWRAGIEARPSQEQISGGVVRLSLLWLMFVTMVPFSSGVVSRYGDFAPAVVLYAANMIAIALLTIAIRYLDVSQEQRSLAVAAGMRLPVFIISAVVSIGVGLLAPRYAMYAYLLNPVARLLRLGRAPASHGGKKT